MCFSTQPSTQKRAELAESSSNMVAKAAAAITGEGSATCNSRDGRQFILIRSYFEHVNLAVN